MRNNEVSAYLENISVLILGILLLTFPLIFATVTTDPFILPKQIILAGAILVSILLFGAKMISEGAVRIRRTPFDFPLLLLTVFILLSAIFSINRYDALTGFVPLLLAVCAYFIIVNVAKTKPALVFLLFSLVTGAAITSLISILSYLKIYILPYQSTHFQTFTPFGSLFDQAIYFAVVLPIAFRFAAPMLKLNQLKSVGGKELAGLFSTLILIAGFFVTLTALFTLQKPVVLPLETGFQTAMAAISQDTGRVVPGFFLGSGFGTYATDFTRFKQAAFNTNPNLWSLTFFRSSSFILELLATTGILGFLSYVFLALKVVKGNNLIAKSKENSVYLSLILLFAASFLLPLTFITQTFLFFLLGLFAAYSALKEDGKYFDIELHFVAFKNGIIPLSASPVGESSRGEKTYTKILPVIVFGLSIVFVGLLAFYTVRYVASDVIFQRSLVAASANNGLQTYNDEINAIQLFPYRDSYHRIYSQTNLALANSLAAQQPKGSSPSAQVQQTITTLIQQSINSGRNAANLSPLTAANWQNLSSVYRSLIGFGQNAETFAILSNQQAAALDPNNPQQYINLGGIYYQLGLWDNAQRQFQIAVNLKPDFANAYYNLGHALESKGDLQAAVAQYQAVQSLVSNDKESLKKITAEIQALQKKIAEQQNQQAQQNQAQVNAPAQNQPAIELNTPQNQLPEQKTQMKIPGPGTTLTPSPSASPSPAPSIQP